MTAARLPTDLPAAEALEVQRVVLTLLHSSAHRAGKDALDLVGTLDEQETADCLVSLVAFVGVLVRDLAGPDALCALTSGLLAELDKPGASS